MAFCSSCGNQIDDNAVFCNSCGARQSQQAAPSYAPQQAYTYNQAPSYAPQYGNGNVKKSSSMISLIFGIVALSSAFLCIYSIITSLFMFLPVSIVFLCISKAKRKQHVQAAGSDNGMTRAGNILSTIAIPVCILSTILSIIVGPAIMLTLI